MASRIVFGDSCGGGGRDAGGGASGTARLIGAMGVAYVVVLVLLLIGGVLLRLHVDGAAAAPIVPLGRGGAWFAFSA